MAAPKRIRERRKQLKNESKRERDAMKSYLGPELWKTKHKWYKNGTVIPTPPKSAS